MREGGRQMKRKETLALERNLEEKIYTKVKKRKKKVGRSNDSSNDSFYDVCSFKIRLKAKVLAEEGVSGGGKRKRMYISVIIRHA